MASLSRTRYGVYELTFVYANGRIHRSLRTKDEAEAHRLKGVIEKTLTQLEDGLLAVPQHLTTQQLWSILRSGGRAVNRPQVTPQVALSEVCRRYFKSYTEGTKEQTTLTTEQHHLNHLQRLLGSDVSFTAITTDDLRRYVETRQQEPGTHGRRISSVTIGKELQTFRQLWDFAKGEGMVSCASPLKQIRRPRGSQKPRFMTLDEIQATLERGGLTEPEIAELWECLFLRESEIADFLEHVRTTASAYPRFPYIYSALAFCAYTGARRSEMFRCQVHDVRDTVQIREKKRSQRDCYTFRQVPLHPQLRAVLDGWRSVHPGGKFFFCKNNTKSLDDKTAREAFEAVTKRSRWSVLRGFHILRHSFASNLARHGVDQRVVDEFMGHQTEAMRKRYLHLFPDQTDSAISALDYSNGPEQRPTLRVVG